MADESIGLAIAAAIAFSATVLSSSIVVVGYLFRTRPNREHKPGGGGPRPGESKICDQRESMLTAHAEQIARLREMALVAAQERGQFRRDLQRIERQTLTSLGRIEEVLGALTDGMKGGGSAAGPGKAEGSPG